ncbi:MAG: NAD(P)H-binding protein [Eubacteriales bacterium]|nr:NAD(P)H-binding protein [Eubacteriales bacterium]
MLKTAVLTGVTGKSGQYAIERLIQRKNELDGVQLRAIVRSAEKMPFLCQSGLSIELCVGSVDDDEFLLKTFSGADTLLHIVGIHTSLHVIPLAIQAGIRRIITVHTTGIYSKYKSASAEYNRIDSEISRLCAQSNVLLTILRPTMIYGGLDDENVVKFIAMMDRFPRMPVVSGARFALQPVHRRDLGMAYADVLLSEATAGKNYVLSGAEPILLRDMLTVIAGYLGKPAKFVSIPYWIAISGAWALYFVTFTKIDYREKVQRLVEPRAYPHDEATRDFGYTPLGFSEGVKDEAEAYLARKREKGMSR